MKILLIQPRSMGVMDFGAVMCYEPLGLEDIAALLENEHEVKLLDLFHFDDLAQTLSSFEPDICGISCSFTVDVNKALRIAEFAKRSKGSPVVVIGGHHASLSPEDFCTESIDAIVIGEGEITFSELVSCLSGNGDLESVPGLALNRDGEQFFTEPRSLIKNLDQLPLPARHLSKPFRKEYFLGLNRPVAMIESTRGCPYRCNFCSVHTFFQDKVRFKSAERLVEELSKIEEKVVFFSDDNFFIHVPRAQEMAALIKDNKIKKRYYVQSRSDIIVKHPELIAMWKEVGLSGAFIGFEKIDEEGLKSVNKQNTVENNEKALEILNSHGMSVVAAFIVDPDETREGFARLRRYVDRLQLKTTQFTVLTPLPGTELFAQMKERIVTKKHELFDGFHAVLPTKLPLPDFYKEFSKLYASVLERSIGGRAAIANALSQLRSGQLSLSHIKRLSKTGKMLTDYRNYLAGHMDAEGCLPPQSM
jgi:radical SAM superfamily enzyme YgiQ (UPF0313 family)